MKIGGLYLVGWLPNERNFFFFGVLCGALLFWCALKFFS